MAFPSISCPVLGDQLFSGLIHFTTVWGLVGGEECLLGDFIAFHLSCAFLCGVTSSSPGCIVQTVELRSGAGAEGAILPYAGHIQLISTLKIVADCCQLCQYKLTKPNQA